MQLVYLLASVSGLDLEKAQRLLEASEQLPAMKLLHEHMRREYQILELRKEIAGQAESAMGREQREYLLRQQLRAIEGGAGGAGPGRRGGLRGPAASRGGRAAGRGPPRGRA